MCSPVNTGTPLSPGRWSPQERHSHKPPDRRTRGALSFQRNHVGWHGAAHPGGGRPCLGTIWSCSVPTCALVSKNMFGSFTTWTFAPAAPRSPLAPRGPEAEEDEEHGWGPARVRRAARHDQGCRSCSHLPPRWRVSHCRRWLHRSYNWLPDNPAPG